MGSGCNYVVSDHPRSFWAAHHQSACSGRVYQMFSNTFFFFNSEAITCRAVVVNIGSPFKPSFPINGAPSKGLTYAYDLLQYNRYSDQLVHTVWECLYEKPAHRPENIDLKRRAVEGYNLAVLKATKVRLLGNAFRKCSGDSNRFAICVQVY